MGMLTRVKDTFFAPLRIGRDQATGWSERLAGLTTITSSLEYLSQRRHLKPGGLNDWRIMREQEAVGNPVLKSFLDFMAHPRVTLGLHGLRVAAGTALLLPGNSRWRGAASLFLSGTTAALYPRHRFGTDGSDQVSMIVQGTVGLARLTRSSAVSDALSWYIAIQGTLSYAVAGWAKLLGDKWRSGAALPGVLRTRTYGFEKAYQLVNRHPKVSTVMQHAILAWECLFPLIYLFRGRLVRPFLGTAVSFHVANAFIMGLGRFMTSFPAMHPFIAYTALPASDPWAKDRDDDAVKVAAVLLGAAAAVAGGIALQKRIAILGGWPTSRRLTTRSGNVLQFESGGTAQGDSPIVLFDAGLASTPEHCSWISEKLITETDCGLVVYSRAGYGGSQRRSRDEYSLQESVDDLVDLARAVHRPEGRRVVLVGHSLGGELARRAALQLQGEDTLAGIVYLDPSHPAELQRSEAQRMGMENMTTSLNLAKWSLRLGTGLLMSRPDWLERLPLAYRDKIYAQYSDSRMWTAAAREWKAVEQDFLDHDGHTQPMQLPGQVIAAENTVEMDDAQLEMYRELAAALPALPSFTDEGGMAQNLHVLPGVDHDSILTNSRHAHVAADLIIAFLTGQCGARLRSDLEATAAADDSSSLATDDAATQERVFS